MRNENKYILCIYWIVNFVHFKGGTEKHACLPVGKPILDLWQLLYYVVLVYTKSIWLMECDGRREQNIFRY